MKIYLPEYDNGMDWENSVFNSKNAYSSYEEAEKEILSRDMKLSMTKSSTLHDGQRYYEVDIEKRKQTHEQYYVDNPEEKYEPFYDYRDDERAYIVTLNLEEKFNPNHFTEDTEWFI